MRALIAAILLVSLAACQQGDPWRSSASFWQNNAAKAQEVYLDDASQERRLAAETAQVRAAQAEYFARSECSYKAQEANSNNFGLVHGFFAGLGTGSACINYYRDIGVIRN